MQNQSTQNRQYPPQNQKAGICLQMLRTDSLSRRSRKQRIFYQLHYF